MTNYDNTHNTTNDDGSYCYCKDAENEKVTETINPFIQIYSQ